MVMDMGFPTMITAVLYQGRNDQTWEFVEKMQVEISMDNISYESVGKAKGGFTMYSQTNRADLSTERLARYVKLKVEKFNAWCSMRAGVIMKETTPNVLTRITARSSSPPSKKHCRDIQYDPCEQARTYSSVFFNDAIGTGHAQSSLASTQAWSAATQKAGEYVIMDIGAEAWLSGVITMGRADEGWEYSKTITIETSLDGNSFTAVEDGKEFAASRAPDRRKFVWLTKIIKARYVKVIIQTWQEWPSIKTGVILCGEDLPEPRPTGPTQLAIA